MTILGVDPGPQASGVVEWDGTRVVRATAEMPNDELRVMLLRDLSYRPLRIAIEWIQAMGMPVGQEVFLTCRFIGRLEEIADARGQVPLYITRPTIKTRLCGSPRAKDPNVRQALIDRLGPVGTKRQPGPLFGVTSHGWSALAVAIAVDLP